MKVRKKPVVVEAIQFLATAESFYAILSMGVKWSLGPIGSEPFNIEVIGGTVTVRKGDYVIKGVNGEFYPCTEEIFNKTYDIITNEESNSSVA